MNKIIVYSDGGARQNGKKNNVGGWGVFLQFGEHTKELCGGKFNTTNNQMELQAAIEGLKAIKKFNIPVEIRTDSAYVCNGINSWVDGWMRNGWVTANKKTPVQNRELWMELVELKSKFPFIQFTEVKGHSGEPGNEKADQLANKAMDELSK